ncbi:endonuclease YncB(thermonuclease family) [Altererythrobacter atlanticus]|uniref:Endonuclease YncB n=1 Tax=Croceibacterium atlanticum TaxID=1267766 RepID=A0A0F7KUZ3_9SPHN|nr:thermonuclease family protein [Croceibacterium atlanticum]AKH43057.1 Endonuclease YncB precursor [Croceibacterium atlanticum]MBB5732240.1 endonuclease YncB(thermonuclease family) [Croceibacterium atlanticum]
MPEQTIDDATYRRGYRRRNNVWRELSWFLPALIAVPLAAASVATLGLSPPKSQARPVVETGDIESAQFAACTNRMQTNCVIDGDTLYYRGQAIRIADINAPEAGRSTCAKEARIGSQAAARLQDLLNAAPFSLHRNPDGPNEDRYGRLLRTITRDGQSIGQILVAEGLAENPENFRRGWC